MVARPDLATVNCLPMRMRCLTVTENGGVDGETH
jgi:hypothetical protein